MTEFDDAVARGEAMQRAQEKAWGEYRAKHGYEAYPTQPDTGADFAAGFERGVAAVQKVYLVVWNATYEDNGHHTVHRTQEGAQAEADRKNAEEEAYMKEHPHAYSRNWYEVEEMELKA